MQFWTYVRPQDASRALVLCASFTKPKSPFAAPQCQQVMEGVQEVANKLRQASSVPLDLIDCDPKEAERAHETELWLPVLESALLNSQKLVELAEELAAKSLQAPAATAAPGRRDGSHQEQQQQASTAAAAAGGGGRQAPLAMQERVGSILDVARECIEGVAALVLAEAKPPRYLISVTPFRYHSSDELEIEQPDDRGVGPKPRPVTAEDIVVYAAPEEEVITPPVPTEPESPSMGIEMNKIAVPQPQHEHEPERGGLLSRLFACLRAS